MTAKTLANHYSQLSAEERFRLIVAAGDRGDEAEQTRLSNASKRITFSNLDYSPFAKALQELAIMVFLEMLEEAAMYRDAFELWSDADRSGLSPATAKKKTLTFKDQACGVFLAQGFMLRTKAAGWKLFCDRLGISPFGVWQYLPGFERLQRELSIAEGTPDQPGSAYTPQGAVRWLNTGRPSGDPVVTEARIITADRFADSIDAAFQERVRWSGGS